MAGDELVLFNPDDGEEEFLVDEHNEVLDLRRERSKKAVKEEDSSEELRGAPSGTGEFPPAPAPRGVAGRVCQRAAQV